MTVKTSTLLAATLVFLLLGCGTTRTAAPIGATQYDGAILLADQDGQRHDVRKILGQGQSVALVFWQTWCVKCRAEGPELVRAANAFAGKIEFFGVVSGPDSVVDNGRLQTVTELLALPYPQIRDRDGSIAEQFGVQSTPTIIVLGNRGKELYRGSALPKNWSALAGG